VRERNTMFCYYTPARGERQSALNLSINRVMRRSGVARGEIITQQCCGMALFGLSQRVGIDIRSSLIGLFEFGAAENGTRRWLRFEGRVRIVRASCHRHPFRALL